MAVFTVKCPVCGQPRRAGANNSIMCDKCKTRFSVGSNGEIKSSTRTWQK